MNYFLDLIPSKKFIENLGEYYSNINKKINIVLNVYIKQLPSMNINKYLYIDINDYKKIIEKLKKYNFQINIIFDTFCLVNKEFSEQGNEILEIIYDILQEKPEYFTITNNFYYRYIKTNFDNVKLIYSEYAEINNVQKINRYLEDLESSCVKIDTLLLKDKKQMQYISSNFKKDSIHINLNKGVYKNNIYSDTLNNNIAHYIQKERWNDIKKLLLKCKEEFNNENQELVKLDQDDINYLIDLGFNNLWYYSTTDKVDEYLKDIKKFLNNDYKDIKQYPWDLI